MNIDDVPGLEDMFQNFGWCQDNARLGTYSWSFQELLKGRVKADAASRYGGWSFNTDPADGYYSCTIMGTSAFLPPLFANQFNDVQLKTRPFFEKKPRYSKLYSSSSVQLTEYEIEELLANEIPALTFAAGHKGIGQSSKNVDIRQKYINGSWPRPNNEWRHSDMFTVAYPYLYKFYNSISGVLQGGVPQ